MPNIDELTQVMGDDGQFSAQDEAVDRPGHTVQAWVAVA